MKDIPVEYNTGDGVSQGGAMVLETPPGEKPDYVTRLAPFRVYDCLCRTDSGEIPVKNRKAAAYLCLVPDKDLEPGEYHLSLGAETEEGFWEAVCP